MQELINRAKELLADGTVARVLGWKAGDLPYNPEPAYFETEESLKNFVYNGFCGANLSKYMIEASKLEGKTLVCLKPCDTYSFNQLIKEHRVDREKAYIIGVGCKGKLDIEKIRKQGIKGIESISGAEITDEAETLTIQTIYGEKTCAYKDAMLERCHVCKGKEHKIYDELIGESKETKDADRFAEVEKIEAMSPEEKFAFFQNELSKCIRCNACRNVCPACSCRKCVFDSNKFDSAQKANVDSFEEKMFHIIRAFHVAGRCTDCGECSRVCPQGIPLHLFNRKFIKDIDTFYGEYQAGEDSTSKGPLTNAVAELLNDADEAKVEEEKTAIRTIVEKLPYSNLSLEGWGQEDYMDRFNSPVWEELYKPCLACGTCTFVCPTCQCYDIKDYDTGHGVQRYRCWDSCMYSDFTMMAHGNNRNSQMQRFRQRFMHKLVYYPVNNNGMFSCVGCGRCVEKCPSSLNIVKVIKAFENQGGEK